MVNFSLNFYSCILTGLVHGLSALRFELKSEAVVAPDPQAIVGIDAIRNGPLGAALSSLHVRLESSFICSAGRTGHLVLLHQFFQELRHYFLFLISLGFSL